MLSRRQLSEHFSGGRSPTLLVGRAALHAWRKLRHGWPPGSIWGVANPLPLPAVFTPGSDTTCTAGTEVTCVTTTAALTGVPGQNYVPWIFGCLAFLMGGTASAALVIGARFHSGTDFATQTVDTGMLVNSATLSIPVAIIGANARCAGNGNYGSGAIEVTAKATTTACTCRQVASQIMIALLPGPDTQI